MSETKKKPAPKKAPAPTAHDPVKRTASGQPKKAPAAKKKPDAKPATRLEQIKGEVEAELIPSDFPPIPDAKLAGGVDGRPYTFDKNLHCENPQQRIGTVKECKPPITVCLTFCERDGQFSASYRLDVPAFGEKKEPKSYGPFYPFAGVGTLGYKSGEIALYEAARQALEVMQSHPENFPTGAAGFMAHSVERLRPAAAKLAESGSSIVGYDPTKANEYMLAQHDVMIVHANGVEFSETATQGQMENIGRALEHIEQKSNFIKGDWYNAMKKRFPKILDTLIASDTARRTYVNLGSICAAFPLEDRTYGPAVTFTHYAETLVRVGEGDGKAVLTAAQRKTYLALVDKGGEDGKGLSTLKLRAKIAEDHNKKQKTLPTGGDNPQNPADATQPAAGTPTAPDAQTPAAGQPAASAAPSSGSQYAPGNQESEEETQTPPPSEAETINAKQGKVVEYIDYIESFLRAGHHKSAHLSASKQRDVKNMVAKLYELVNK